MRLCALSHLLSLCIAIPIRSVARVSIVSPKNLEYLPSDFYSADLFVIPLWGLYSNMLAQLVSQLSSHVIIYYHRHIVFVATDTWHATTDARTNAQSIGGKPEEANDTKNIPTEKRTRRSNNGVDGIPDASSKDQHGNHFGKVVVAGNQFVVLQDGQTRRLNRHQFVTPRIGKSAKLAPRPSVNGCLVLLAICVGVFVTLGCVLKSFSFDVLGIIGVGVEIGQNFEDAKSDHSVFTLIQLVLDQTRQLGIGRYFIGLGTLCTLVIVSVLVVPILQSIVLLYQWFRPMSLQTRQRVCLVNETLGAWQYSEVYLLSLFVARYDWMSNGIFTLYTVESIWLTEFSPLSVS
jgi:hypothetical protein